MKFSEIQRDLIFEFAHHLTGSSLSFRAEVIIHNVSSRMRACAMTSLTDYFEFALTNQIELNELISAMTIHTTHWFRDPTQLKEVENLIEKILSEKRDLKPFRILSAGCSSGQEVYTLALIMKRVQARLNQWSCDFEVVGCDIDPINLQVARSGHYDSRAGSESFSDADLNWFQPHGHRENQNSYSRSDAMLPRTESRVGGIGRNHWLSTDCSYEVKSELRIKTTFKASNLLSVDEFLVGQFDLVMCRNVLIYFDSQGVRTILSNLVSYLKADGILVLGAGEAVSLPFHGSSNLGHSIFKIDKTPQGTDRVSQASEPIIKLKPAKEMTLTNQFSQRATKILFVDDDLETLEIYKEYCTLLANRDSIDVRTFTDPHAALSYLKGHTNHVDVIFVDFEMPVINGNQFLAELRQFEPNIPCVLVSGYGGNSVFSRASGFTDMIAKPMDMDCLEKCLKMFSNKGTQQKEVRKNGLIPDAVLIGVSTGGPPLLESMLRQLAPSTPPVVVVQHLSSEFSAAFARQLCNSSGLKLGVVDGVSPLLPGHLYLSLDAAHLYLNHRNGQLLALAKKGPPIHGQCPAVDPLFESAAALQGRFHFLAGLFTGMGRDGGKGLLQMNVAGSQTFVQNEATSVVYGMPKFAKELGAASSEGAPQDFRKMIDAAAMYSRKAKAG